MKKSFNSTKRIFTPTLFSRLPFDVCDNEFVHVSSSDIICDKDQKKRGDTRSILKRNTIVFILVQTFSKSNSPMSSLAIL
jgi:hypothetical protein